MAHFHTQDDEVTLIQTKKHWFVFVRAAAATLLIGIIPVVAIGYAATFGLFGGLGETATAAILYASSLWIIGTFMVLATVWTNYYLDTWIVTDRRIVYIEQISLFHREVATLRMERVQDVTVSVQGVLETLLGFGTLQVQTAGAVAEYTVIKGVPRPEDIRNAILKQVDRYSERHMASLTDNDAMAPHDTHTE